MKHILALIVIGIFACNPARKIQKAEQIVIYNPQSFEKIGLRWSELNPCANDTFVIDQAVDSLTFADYLRYLDNPPIINSYKADTLPSLLKQAYQLGYGDAKAALLAIKIPKPRPQIVKVAIVDRRKQKMDADSIQKLNVNNALITGQIGQLNIELSKKAKDADKWIYWLIGVSILFLISLYVNIRKYLI